MNRVFVLTGCLAILPVLQGFCGQLVMSEPQVRETIPGQTTSVGYLKLQNTGDRACVIEEVSSPQADRVEVHEHSHSDGAMRMRRVDRLTVEPGVQVTFQSGGYHLMLMELSEPLRRGRQVEITFDFGECGNVTKQFPVIAIKGQ